MAARRPATSRCRENRIPTASSFLRCRDCSRPCAPVRWSAYGWVGLLVGFRSCSRPIVPTDATIIPPRTAPSQYWYNVLQPRDRAPTPTTTNRRRSTKATIPRKRTYGRYRSPMFCPLRSFTPLLGASPFPPSSATAGVGTGPSDDLPGLPLGQMARPALLMRVTALALTLARAGHLGRRRAQSR